MIANNPAAVRQHYERLAGISAPPQTMDALCERFLEWAETYYTRRPGQNDEVKNYVYALSPVRVLYADLSPADFGPVQLAACRAVWLEQDLARTTINQRVKKIRRVLRWAGLAPPHVDPLRAGRSSARETGPVTAVPLEVVERTLPYVGPIIRTMINVQLLTGMRPGELVRMRADEIERLDDAAAGSRNSLDRHADAGQTMVSPRVAAVAHGMEAGGGRNTGRGQLVQVRPEVERADEIEGTGPGLEHERGEMPVPSILRPLEIGGREPHSVPRGDQSRTDDLDGAPMEPSFPLNGARNPASGTSSARASAERVSSVWIYRPSSHKTAHHGHRRVIYLGPSAQRLLAPLMAAARSAGAGTTSAPTAAAARSAARCSWMFTNRRGTPYTVTSYAQAIRRACDRHGLPRWSPNQLRHLTAQRIDREYGREAAAAVLGHARVETTAIYSARNEAAAMRVAEQLG